MSERWAIANGDYFRFDIVRVKPRRDDKFGSDADLSGAFPTRLAAIESVIAAYEDTRCHLNAQIARAKRMRARAAQTEEVE